MLVPCAGAISVTTERDLPIPPDCLKLVDDLPANGTEVRGSPLNWDAIAVTFTRKVEEVADNVLDAMHTTFDDVGVLLRHPGPS